MARILLLLGGETGEREVSLASGHACAQALSGLGHELRLLDPLRPRELAPLAAFPFGQGPREESPLLLRLEPAQVEALVAALRAEAPDLVFNCLHGGFGEDGHLAALCELLGLPLSSSPSLASALAMDKARTRTWMEGLGLPVAPGRLVPRGAALEVEDMLPAGPLVVKPNCMGSSVGVRIVEQPEDLPAALAEVHALGDDALVEAFVPGRELTCAWLDGRTLPVVEIRPRDGGWYDYRRKYSGGTDYLCPAPLDADLAQRLGEWTAALNQSLGCRGATRTDWRLGPDGRPCCLEINITPGMTDASLVPKAAAAAGLDFPALLACIVEAALR
ncbi:MAG: D-alanine--D-alanine ligase [bacterium]|nr:D-alanine--D-alanine ligase [bacterium]